MNRLLRLWQRPVVYRTAIGLYIALVLTLAGITFSVNSLDVQGAMYVRGEVDLEKGRHHGMRGAFHYAPTGEVLVPETMRWELLDDGGAPTDYAPQFIGGEAVDTWPNSTFRLPGDIPDGSYHLLVEATHDDVSELTAHKEVTVGTRPEPPKTVAELRWPRQSWRSDDRRLSSIVERVDAVEIEPDEPSESPEAFDDSDDVDTDEVDADEFRRVGLHIGPPGGELLRGLPQTLVVRTYDVETGHPVPATVRLEAEETLVEHDLETPVETNRLGIGFAEVRPAMSLELRAAVEPNNDDVTRRHFDTADEIEDQKWAPAQFDADFRAVATQYSIDPARRVITADDEIVATAESTLSDGTFMADLYDADGDRLLDALSLRMSDGKSGVRFDAPYTSEASPLLRLQSYRSIYGTNHAWDVAYVLLVDDDSPPHLRRVTAELFDWMADNTDSRHHRVLSDEEALGGLSERQLRQLIDAGLMELPPTLDQPPVLMNTREADREALDAWREEIQADLRWMMALAILAGIIVVIYFVIVGMQRHRREHNLMRELTLDAVDLPEEELQKDERLERLAVLFQGMIVLLTLVAFALGILMVVSYL